MKLENPSVHATTLEHFWMPFTANRAFKAAPRLLAKTSHNLSRAAALAGVERNHLRDLCRKHGLRSSE